MDADFPAAHSMDTIWFAVDDNGQVGYFSSGEAGAVPRTAVSSDAAFQAAERLWELLPRTELLHDLTGRILPEPIEGVSEHCGYGDTRLYFLTSLDPVKHELAERRAVLVPTTEGSGLAVIIRHVPDALHARLHDGGWCQACFWHHQADANDPAHYGLYHYSHLFENWAPGPYGRVAVPRQPAHIDQLPPDLRRLIAQMRFEGLCFATAPHIDPGEHAECESW